MINEHAQKLRVKDGCYKHFRIVGVSAQSQGTQRSQAMNFYEIYPSGSVLQAPTLTTARRHHAVPGRDTAAGCRSG